MFRYYRIKGLMLLFLSLFCFLISHAQNKDIDSLKKIKNLDSAMIYANRLLADAKKKNDHLQQARIIYLQSKFAYKAGKMKESLGFARQALALTNPSDSNTYANSSTMVAYMLSRQGEDIEALKAAFKILRETEQHGWKKLHVLSLACITDLYRSINNIKAALPYAIEASKGAVALKDSSLYIFTLSNLANLYSDAAYKTPASTAKAIHYMETILSPQYFHFLTSFDKARYLNDLGRLYVQVDDKRAEDILHQSLAISQEQKFSFIEKHALIELLTLYVHKGNYKEAIKYGEQASAINPLEHNFKQQRDIYNHLSEAYEGLKNYKLAYEYYQKYTGISDSIATVEKDKNAAELDRKYQTDKRLLIASTETRLFQQQRNYLILLAILIAFALVASSYWLVNKRKREAALMIKEREQLEKLSALKTRFFANISHELRTPLTLIMGPAGQLLEKDIHDETQEKHYLQTIIRNGNKLLNLVNELLDLGKLEAGKLELKLKPVALANFVKIIYQGFYSAAAFKHISYNLVNDIDEQLFTDLDEEKFEKISTNLISNAIKFTPAEGEITITTTTTDDAFHFSVYNTGEGIHPKDLPNVFDRYYQGHNEEQQLQGGTGIGLAIVREFTELMGGTIIIDNRWKENIAFKVSIPLVNPQQHLIETPPKAKHINAIRPNEPIKDDNRTLVMVVEDNPEMAGYIADVLKPAYSLVIASNGIEALSLLSKMAKLPSLVISDVMMPEMDGFTLLKTLKKSEVFCTIPVIMLTALTDKEHRIKALNTGVDDYITKPFYKEELVARTTNLIGNAAARLEISAHSNPALLLDTATVPDGDTINGAEENETIHVSPADLVWLADLETEIRKHIGKTDLNLYMLSDAVAISERQLFRRIKAITGLTPNKYIRTIRLQIAREAIESGKYRTIAEVSYAAGFDTPAYFSKLFKEHYGRDVGELL